MTTRRESILDDIYTSLSAITTINGYLVTVGQVEQVIKAWDEVASTMFPWVGYSVDPRGRAVALPEPPNHYLVRLDIIVLGHVNSLPGAAKTSALANLEDSIIVAMCSPTKCRRGGHAIDTIWDGTLTDEGDNYKSHTGTVLLDFTITYERDTTST